MGDTAPRVARRHRDPAPGVPRSTARRARGATAATVLAGLTLLAACGDDDDQEAQGTTTTTTADATTTTAVDAATSTTEGAPSDHGVLDAAATARAWIAAIASGDDQQAMALVSDRSMEAIGGGDGYRENEIALAEGWGSWHVAERLEVTAVLLDERTSIVVLHGDVPQEGPPAESWAALPVVATPEGDRVEPFIQLGEPTVDPPASSEVAPEPSVTVDAPEGVTIHAGWDALGISPVLEGEVVSAQTLEPGVHGFVVVLQADDGRVMARTYLYRVEG